MCHVCLGYCVSHLCPVCQGVSCVSDESLIGCVNVNTLDSKCSHTVSIGCVNTLDGNCSHTVSLGCVNTLDSKCPHTLSI